MRNRRFTKPYRSLFRYVLLMATLVLVGCAARIEPPQLPVDQAPGDYSYLKTYITDLIRADMKLNKIVGLSIAVVHDQETVWSEGFGYAVKSQKKLAEGNTVYRAGSITKLFTAIGIMQLAEQGLVDIDNPISAYLPEFSIKSRFADMRAPTLRDLLTHHSGLPSDRFKDWAWESPPPDDYEEVFLELPTQFTDDYMARPPGAAFAYSNLGFSLLGNVIARVSGESYPDYIENHILKPLGMERSAVIVNDRIRGDLAKGYTGKKESETPYIRDLPAGSLLSSANDMARFIGMILGKGTLGETRVLSPETLERVFVPQNEEVPLDLDFRIGLAFWLVNPMGLELAGYPASHGGDLPPYHAILVTLPSEGLGVVVMSNSDQSSTSVMKIAIETIRLAHEIKTGKRPRADEVRPVIALDDSELTALTGTYSTFMGLSRVTRKGNRAIIRLAGFNLDLVPHPGNRFSVRFRLFGLIPLKIPILETIRFDRHEIEGSQYLALYMNDMLMGLAGKFEPVSIPEVWLERVGKYENIEGEENAMMGDFRLDYDKKASLLLLKIKALGSRMVFPLEPVNDTEAITIGQGRNLGETVRFEEEGELLVFSGLRLKRR
ncbi:MAG: beta-lactamase family protein [Fidelibacterota bacterium]|nr:MAG: beta-lactamase family protein [Candidatus Neomarinimicrobiota bacterium]